MTITADKYYGDAAKRYDEDRHLSQRWKNEQQAVRELVDSGPVLDVPFGTGRYVPIYRDLHVRFQGIDVSADMIAVAHRKHGDVDARIGSIFDLPFSENSFEIAVCTRFLDWLPPDRMVAAIGELRRVARCIVLTIRHGVEGISINYTHDLSKFYHAIDGLIIDSRRLMEQSVHGTEEMFKLRLPVWHDVFGQFRWHDGNIMQQIQRLSDEWVGKILTDRVDMAAITNRLTCEYWTCTDVSMMLGAMAHYDPDYITDAPPRCDMNPAVVLEVGDSRVVLDGRRRLNARNSGRHPVLVIRP